jgi:type IV pilus biogenesis protein CpaD/CtpE
MKKSVMVFMVGAALALSACTTKQNSGGAEEDYVESQAPYAPERTVGGGDKVFSHSQRK